MRKVGYMKMIQFKSLIEQIPAGMPVTLSYGGESIVHPEFEEMARLATEQGHRVTVYSNGLREYPGFVEAIVYAKPPPIILTWDQCFQDPNNLKPVHRDCAELYYGINILWNGDVVPCCHCVAGNRVVGNVYESSIETVWGGSRFKMLRVKGHCEGCEIYRYDLSAKGVEDYAKQTDSDYRVRLK